MGTFFGLANLLPDSSMDSIHSPLTLAYIFILDFLLVAVTGYIFRVASFTFSIIIGFNCFLSFFPQTLDLLLSSSLKRTLVRFTTKLPTEQLFCLEVSKKIKIKIFFCFLNEEQIVIN